MTYEISVIIPIYNVENYIKGCLDSIVNQTLGIENIEVILVNDATLDNSMKIAHDYAQKYSSFKIIEHEKNKGLGESRNTGLKHVTSNYITFVDSDDFISVNTFEDSLLKMKNNDSDLLIYNLEIHENNTQKTSLSIHQPNINENKIVEDINKYPKLLFFTSVCNKIFKKNLIKFLKFPKGLYEDNVVSLESFINAKRIFLNKDSKYYYRKNSESITEVISIENSLDLSKTIKNILEIGEKNQLYSKNIRLLALYFTNDVLFWIYNYNWNFEDEKIMIDKLKSSAIDFSKEDCKYFKSTLSIELLYEEDILNLFKFDSETFLAKYKYFRKFAHIDSIANLYVDTGNGFNEEDKISINYKLKKSNKISFSLDSFDNIQNLRFDPIEGVFSKIKINAMNSNIKSFKIAFSNCENNINDEYQVFSNLDPQYHLNGNFTNVSYIDFDFELIVLDNNILNNLFLQKNNMIINLRKEIDNLNMGNLNE